MIADLLPWLNVLLIPVVGGLLSYQSRLTRLETEVRMLLVQAGYILPGLKEGRA